MLMVASVQSSKAEKPKSGKIRDGSCRCHPNPINSTVDGQVSSGAKRSSSQQEVGTRIRRLVGL